MKHIDYYFATISPYSYLAGTKLEEIAKKNNATIAYKPLDIVALFGRTGGTVPAQRHVSRQEYRLLDMERQASEAGLKLNIKPAHFPTNPAPSSYALIAAQKAGGGDVGALAHSILAACWANDQDIAEDEVIKGCLKGAGFDPALADSGLLSGAEEYAANLEEAVNAGVFGAPFYITNDGGRFWGQDRLAALDRHLQGAN